MAISNVGDIKKYLDSDLSGGPTARPIGIAEFRAMSDSEKSEIGDMARKEMKAAGLEHSKP